MDSEFSMIEKSKCNDWWCVSISMLLWQILCIQLSYNIVITSYACCVYQSLLILKQFSQSCNKKFRGSGLLKHSVYYMDPVIFGHLHTFCGYAHVCMCP